MMFSFTEQNTSDQMCKTLTVGETFQMESHRWNRVRMCRKCL